LAVAIFWSVFGADDALLLFEFGFEGLDLAFGFERRFLIALA
jgi:hypothetical protein